jgi:SOS-response transcriptional repressor LexA
MLCKLRDEFKALDVRFINLGCGLCLSEQVDEGLRCFLKSLESAQEGPNIIRGLSLLGLGAAYLCCEEVSEASNHYEQAEDILLSVDPFAGALARFGLGLIEWAQGNHSEALGYLLKSRETLDEVPYDQRSKSLCDEVSRMRREAEETLAKATLPLRSERPEVELVPVVGEIPASAPFHISKCRIGEISTREILVNGEPYYFQPLDTAMDVPFGFASGETYFSLRVTGTSMQDADIEDRDYVVVRRDEEPSSGKIVAARIGDGYTVKRYCPQYESGYVSLQPESETTKPIIVAITRAGAAMIRDQYQDDEDVQLVENPICFDLLGEVVAVLKRLAP